jgi:hypothetical protein
MARKKPHVYPNITVIARKNGPLGLQWGETAEVPATDYVEHLVETGALEWVDEPAAKPVRAPKPEPEPEPEPVVEVSSPDDNLPTAGEDPLEF